MGELYPILSKTVDLSPKPADPALECRIKQLLMLYWISRFALRLKLGCRVLGGTSHYDEVEYLWSGLSPLYLIPAIIANMSFKFIGIIGVGGTIIVILAILYSAITYRGKQGERFSLLNHFISELGEGGVSRKARFFNLGLIFGGFCLLPCVIWLGVLLNSLLGWLGMVAGIVASLGVVSVGFFPMNNLKPHGHAAMAFFRGGLAMLTFFGFAILLQPACQEVIPKFINILTLLAVFSYALFLVLLMTQTKKERSVGMLNTEIIPERPVFWWLPTLEWVVFFSTILWLFGIAFLI